MLFSTVSLLQRLFTYLKRKTCFDGTKKLSCLTFRRWSSSAASPTKLASTAWSSSTSLPRTSGTRFEPKATEHRSTASTVTPRSTTHPTRPSTSTGAWPLTPTLESGLQQGCSRFTTLPESGLCCRCERPDRGRWATPLRVGSSTRPSAPRTTSCCSEAPVTQTWKKVPGPGTRSFRRPSTCTGAASGSTSSTMAGTSSRSWVRILSSPSDLLRPSPTKMKSSFSVDSLDR